MENIVVSDSSGKKLPSKSLWPWVIGFALLVLACMFTIAACTNRSGDDDNRQAKLTAEAQQQLKIDQSKELREQRQIDALQDQALLLRDSDVPTAAPLLRELTIPTVTEPGDRKKIQQEEEAINFLLHEQPPAPKPEPPSTAAAQQSAGNPTNLPPMFVYSRSFGGAKYTEPKAAQATKSDELSDAELLRMALGMGLPSHEPSSANVDIDTEPGDSPPAAEKQTRLIYSGLPPVVVNEGEMLEAVLVNRLIVNTESSPVVCTLSRDLFDRSGKYVVFPANSRVIGSAQAVNYKGASRLFISFHRIILPNGMSVDLPQSQKMMKALDETGALGVVSHVNRHWMMQFGAAIMLGVIDGVAGWTQRNNQVETADGYVISRTSENFDKILDRIMSQYSSIMPTISVFQGKTMRVYIADDMMISPYSLISDRSYYGSRR